MKNSRLFYILLCLVLLTGLSACGNSKQAPDSDTASGKETKAGTYTIDNIRDYVVGVDEQVELEDGSTKALINFDNAATTPALQPVVDFVGQTRSNTPVFM